MIFLTVGSHEPFDRLVQGVDEWCAARGTRAHVFAQITDRAKYTPRNFHAVSTLNPSDFATTFSEAQCIISHAGMGTIINALTAGKPIAVMPRRGHLNETRNDHQVATVQRMRDRPGLLVADTEADLPTVLDALLDFRFDGRKIAPSAEQQLIDAIRAVIFDRDG